MGQIKSCVSLYSLQDEYLNHRMTLNEIIHYVKDCGAQGIEILPDQMLKGAPDLSDETLASWNKIIKEIGITPVCADVFLNTNLYKNRTLTKKECIDLLIKEIIQANKLGIHLIRLVSMIPYWVIEPLLPYCEKYDVTIALEIHAGMAFDEKETQKYLAEMKRVNSKYVGIVVDTGIFCRKFPRVVKEYESINGTKPEIFAYMDKLFERGTDYHREIAKAAQEGSFSPMGFPMPEEVKKLITNEHEAMFILLCDGYENYQYSCLDEYIPFIKHFHFKFFEMTEDGEYSMDYKGLLEYLHSKDWSGYVSSEYEGNRWTIPGKKIVEKEQVASHVAYVNKCISELGK